MDAVLDVQKNRYIGVDVGGTRLKLRVVSGRGAVSDAARNLDEESRDVLGAALTDLAAIAARRAGRDLAAAIFGE